MPRHIAPELLATARMEALRFSRRSGVDRDEAVGWAYLALVELAEKMPELCPNDSSLVTVAVRHRLIDWQRRESLLTRGERDRRDIHRYRVPLEDAHGVRDTSVAIPDPWLREAIDALPASERRAVVAVYAQDTKAAEYARETHYSEARISQFINSALRKLRALFHKDDR